MSIIYTEEYIYRATNIQIHTYKRNIYTKSIGEYINYGTYIWKDIYGMIYKKKDIYIKGWHIKNYVYKRVYIYKKTYT